SPTRCSPRASSRPDQVPASARASVSRRVGRLQRRGRRHRSGEAGRESGGLPAPSLRSGRFARPYLSRAFLAFPPGARSSPFAVGAGRPDQPSTARHQVVSRGLPWAGESPLHRRGRRRARKCAHRVELLETAHPAPKPHGEEVSEMTAGWQGSGGLDPFEELLARFFGTRAQRRPMERISIARLMSEPAREMLRDAATQAAQGGSFDLDTDHLLWAATRQQGPRHWLERAGADPDKIRHEIEEHARRGEPRDVAPELTPSAKRALRDSPQVSRALGSSYIGPEHLLFALALDRGSSAGRVLDAEHVTPETLQSAATGGHPPGPPGGGQATGTPTLDEFGRDLTALAREGKID